MPYLSEINKLTSAILARSDLLLVESLAGALHQSRSCSLTILLPARSPALKIFFFFFAVFTTQAFAQNWQQNQSGGELHWSLDEFQFRSFKQPLSPLQGSLFRDISLAKTELTKAAGQPQVPFHSFLVAGEIEEVDFKLGQAEIYEGIQASPAPTMPCRCSRDQIKWEVKKPSLLHTRGYEIHSLGDFRGIKLSRVIVTPFLTTVKGLVAHRSVHLKLKGAKKINDFQALWEDTQTGRHLIIARENYFETMGALIERREAQGIEVLTLEYTGQNFYQLKSQIAELYQSTPFDFALVIGDEEAIPSEYVRTAADPSTPSDLKYFTMGGEFDQLPDVAYGRMVVENPEQLARQIQKIIAYEDQAYGDQSGLGQAISIASNEGANPTDFDYARQMMTPFQDQLGLQAKYFFQGEPRATASDILSAFTSGAHWLNYIGHGVGDSWPSITGEALTIDRFDELGSEGVRPIVIDVACQNGRLSFDRRIGVSLMNQFDQDGPTGAVAYYGGSVDITWHPPAVMAVRINEVVAQRRVRTIGEALFLGQLKLVETYDDLPSALENLVWYHLQGDPAMELDL